METRRYGEWEKGRYVCYKTGDGRKRQKIGIMAGIGNINISTSAD